MKFSIIKSIVNSGYRKNRLEIFLSNFKIEKSTKILDVGGIEETWIGTGLEENVTILNLVNCGDSKILKIVGDARDLSMFPDKCFDIIFSNSVIEHVGGDSEKKSMADEIIRVAKKYWVQTPNKNFPIEIHFMFPFFLFLPHQFKKIIAKYWPFSMAKIFELDPLKELEDLQLLNKTELQSLFPEAIILPEKYFLLNKSLIAIKNF